MKSEGTKHNQEPTNKNLESINAEALDSEKMSSVEGESGAERAEKTKQDKFNETVAKTLDEQDKRDEKQDETIQQQSEKNSEQDRQIDELKQIILGVKDELSSVRDENKSLHQEVQRLRNQEISENDDGIKGYVENESGLDVPEPLTQAIESSLSSEGTMEDTPSAKKTEELTHYEGDYLRRPGESDTDWEGRIREQAGKDYGEDVNVDQIVDQHKKAEEAEFEATEMRESRERIANIRSEEEEKAKKLKEQLDDGRMTQDQYDRERSELEAYMQNKIEMAKTPKERIVDIRSEQEEKSKELKDQLDRGSITQEEYDAELSKLDDDATHRVGTIERIREKKRENFIRKRYAGEDHGSFYDEANTIASEEDQRRYEDWLRRHEPEEPDDSENVPEGPDDPGDSPDSPDSPDNPDDPGDNPDDPEGGPEDPETPGDDPDNPEDPGDSQDDDLDNKLIASRTNREKEGEAYVEHVAEVALNADAEGKRKGLLKGLRKTLKGTVFRSFYKQRYSELVDLKLRSDQGLELGDDEKRKLERAKGSRMWKAMETAMSTADFGDGKVVNERLGKGGAGESAADKVNVREKFGEKAERVDDALTAETRSIMESYISGDMMEKYRNGELDLEEGLSEKEVLDRQFDGLRAKLQGEGGDGGDILAVDNFVEIAEKAKANAEKLESQIEDFSERMDRVFDGFALVSAESRGVTRSEQHKTNLDKIMSRVESSAVGKFIPPAAVAAIGGAGIYLGQRIATGAATAVAPVVGGAAVGGVFSGLKEGNRVSRDRATRGTTMEMGLAGGERRADREIESTMYETYSVSGMMEAMQTAKAKYEESGSDEDRVAWLNEVKKAVVVQDYADENRVGLLAYDSNSEKSLAEQQAEFFGEISQAMATLSPEEQNGFMRATEAEDDVIRQTKEAIEGDRSAKDDVFRRVKRRRMVSTGVKTFAISAAAGFAIQEVAALVNPNQVGVLESRFGIGRQNSATASDTSLNRLLFDRTGRQNVGDKIPESQMDQYRGSDRFIVKKNPDTYHEESRTITETLKGHDKIDVWGNNRTVPYDQNELHLKYDSSEGVPFFDGRGVVTSSETGNTLNLGKSDIDFLIVGSNGRTLRVDTVVDGSGHIVPKDPKVFDGWFDSRGNFLGDRLHVVSDVDGDTWSVATVLGEGSKDSVTRTIVEKVKDPATYAVERIVDVAPAIPFGEARRRNLSTPSRPERPVGGGENPPSAPEEPSDSGNGGGETSDQAIPDSPEETPDNNGENVSDETGSNSNGGDGPQIITETDPNTGDETTTIIDTTGPTTAGGTGGSARTAMDVATGVAGMAAAGVGGAVQGAARAMRAPVNAASNSTRRIVANPIRQNAEPQPVSTGEDSDAYYERVTREQNARDERIREEAEQNRRRREAEEQQARDEAERNRRLREEEEQRIRQEAIAAQQAQQTQRAQQVQ